MRRSDPARATRPDRGPAGSTRTPSAGRPRSGRSPRGAVARVLLDTTAIGIRRRPVAFFGLAILAAGAVVVAVASPLLLRAAQQSALAAATPRSLLAAVLTYSSFTTVTPDLGQGVVTPSSRWRTVPPVTTTSEAFPWQRVGSGAGDGARTVSGHLVEVSGRCTGVRVVSGRCPSGDREIAVSTASEVPIGAQVQLTSTGLRPRTVVGRYAPSDGGPASDPLTAAALRTVDRARANDLLVTRPTLGGAAGSALVTVVGVGLTHPLRLEDVPEVGRTLARARADLAQVDAVTIATPIDQVLAAQRADADAAALLALALAAQTLAVSWAAQGLLVGVIARARAGEWGVARLRGFRSGRRLVALFAEPVAAVLLGSLAGYVLATLVAQGVASTTAAAVVQPLQPLPLVVGGLAVLGSAVALLLASARSATLPLAQLLRERAEPRRIGRLALIAQSGVVLATALVVYSVLTGGRVTGPQLPLLAPALVAVTVGFLALRIAVPLLRRALRPIPSSLTGLLVGRRVIRTPSLLAIAVVLCTAVALTTAATQTLLTSDRLQHSRAEAAVGAARVLDVRAPVGTDLVAAVRRADSSGRLAMAAVDLDDGAGPQRVVAVDTARLGAVSSWHPSWGGMSATRLHRLLAPVTGPALRLVGRRVDVGLANTSLPTEPGGVLAVRLPDLELSMTVQNGTGFHRLVLGRLSTDRFTSALPCPSGCRIVAFEVVNRGEDYPFAFDADIASLSTDLQPATETAALLRPGLWRQQTTTVTFLDSPPTIRIARGASGLALSVVSPEGRALLALVPRDTPQPVPVLPGPQLVLRQAGGVRGAFLGSGLGFESILVRPVGRAAILPRALGDGVLVDLGVMQRASDPASASGRSQVWLSAAAGPAVVAAVQREGLQVIGEQRLPPVEAGFLGEAVPRVALQGAAVGGIGLVLALFALLLSRLLRRPGIRATADLLRAAGADPRTIRRVAVTEAVVPAVAGALLGALAGVLGAALVLPVLPFGAGAGVLPPLDVGVFPAAAIAPAAAAIVLSSLIAALTSTEGRR